MCRKTGEMEFNLTYGVRHGFLNRTIDWRFFFNASGLVSSGIRTGFLYETFFFVGKFFHTLYAQKPLKCGPVEFIGLL